MPTRSKQTEQRYRERAAQIVEAENKAAKRQLSPLELAKAVRAREVCPSSYRQMRAALVFIMEEGIPPQGPARAAELREAIALLRQARPEKSEGENGDEDDNGGGGGPLRTSRQKQKDDVEKDMARICHAALATRSPNAQDLVNLLRSGMLAGPRLVEWPSATFGPGEVGGFAWELKILNGKHTNGRAHGESRTLRWTELPAGLVRAMTRWIETARQAATIPGAYETLLETLESLMRRVTKSLYKKRQQRPTLTSPRHAAAARWKMVYVASALDEDERLRGLAIVAALFGHASDETATRHYARASASGGAYPVPTADPAEVARIRHRLKAMPGGPRKRPDR